MNRLAGVFDDIRTTEDVIQEVLVEGKPGTAPLETFLNDIPVHETPPEAEKVARLEGIAIADAGVIITATSVEDILLANDKALIEVARNHGVPCWWVTTVLLKAVKEDFITASEASDVLYDLVSEGMNLHPQVYSRLQRAISKLGEDAISSGS